MFLDEPTSGMDSFSAFNLVAWRRSNTWHSTCLPPSAADCPRQDETHEVLVEIGKKLLLSGGVVALEDFELDEAYVLKYAQHTGVELQDVQDPPGAK
jgi:hypothetical protein